VWERSDLDEVRGLERRLAEQNAVVRDDAHGHAVHVCETTHHLRPSFQPDVREAPCNPLKTAAGARRQRAFPRSKLTVLP
jgi:hypothetical protein